MSSLKDLASLIMVPSLVKDGRLDTVKPLGNSIIHPDATGNNDGTDGSTPAEGNFTFSRGSNLAATRVDVNGLIEKGRENHLLQSQSFDNASWDKTRNVVTANTTTAPDGTNTADKIAVNATFSTNTSRVKQDISVSGLNTISLYAKADEITEMLLFELGNNNGIYFNLTSGSFVSYLNGTTNIIDYNIEDAGNDWYRYSITYSSSITRYAVYLSKSGSYVTDFTIGEGFYVWGGQIESGLVATDYIETGASTAQAGILEDLPRLDYSGGASCPALLLEPQRTNDIPYSEWFGYSGWTKTRCTITDNHAISPEGFQNAALMTATGDDARLEEAITLSGDYTQSIWVKSGQSGNVAGQIDFAGIAAVTFTANQEWQRVETTNDSFHRVRLRITNSGDKLLVYGAQLEAGSYPTSYIPTMGSAVTRSSDKPTSSSYNYQAEGILGANVGTIILDCETIGTSTGSNDFHMFGAVNSIADGYLLRANSGSTWDILERNGNSTSAQYTSIAQKQTRNKIGISYSGGDVDVYVNGIVKSVSSGTPVGGGNINGFSTSTSNSAGLIIHQILLFPNKLTDSELASLTTI